MWFNSIVKKTKKKKKNNFSSSEFLNENLNTSKSVNVNILLNRVKLSEKEDKIKNFKLFFVAIFTLSLIFFISA